MKFVTVAKAARYLGVSVQRVRVLLNQGRMAGLRSDGRAWQVEFPPIIRGGMRGPRLGHKPAGLRRKVS